MALLDFLGGSSGGGLMPSGKGTGDIGDDDDTTSEGSAGHRGATPDQVTSTDEQISGTNEEGIPIDPRDMVAGPARSGDETLGDTGAVTDTTPDTADDGGGGGGDTTPGKTTSQVDQLSKDTASGSTQTSTTPTTEGSAGDRGSTPDQTSSISTQLGVEKDNTPGESQGGNGGTAGGGTNQQAQAIINRVRSRAAQEISAVTQEAQQARRQARQAEQRVEQMENRVEALRHAAEQGQVSEARVKRAIRALQQARARAEQNRRAAQRAAGLLQQEQNEGIITAVAESARRNPRQAAAVGAGATIAGLTLTEALGITSLL